MAWLPCPYLGTSVELTDERLQHISETHPELLPDHLAALELTLADPDQIRSSGRLARTRLFARWFDDIRDGKYVVAVVIADPPPSGRVWVVTAYNARRLSGGTIEWTRN
jgi:hypothetical protein